MKQMMTPEMTKFAMENMRKMKPEDMRAAAEQMRQMSPDQMSPDNLDQAAVQMGQMMQYELSAATSLKNQGNQLHNAGKYLEATQKYEKVRGGVSCRAPCRSVTLFSLFVFLARPSPTLPRTQLPRLPK